MTIESIAPQAEAPVELVATIPPIASFWRRLGAWIVDMILLGIVGQIIGWSLSFIWFRIGPYGRIIGLLVMLPYFGVLNSHIGGGQTIGKRLLKIAVRDGEDKPIGIGRSLLRISILVLPELLNGLALPIFQIGILGWLQAVIVFGVGGVIIYTMLFNRGTRQGLHDLACGTYVVHLPGKPPIVSFPKVARIHLVISGVLLALVIAGISGLAFIGPKIISDEALAPIYKLYQTLETDDRFFTVGVNDHTTYSSQGDVSRILRIEVWYKGFPSESERKEALNSIAQTVFATMENIDEFDAMSISISTAFDIGIASGSFSSDETRSIEDWRQMINS